VIEDVAMQKPVQIDADLYARAAAAASREGKHVDNYINELIRLQIREAERMYLVARALDEITIKGDPSGNAEGK
jgi:predicted DNA-binding protein